MTQSLQKGVPLMEDILHLSWVLVVFASQVVQEFLTSSMGVLTMADSGYDISHTVQHPDPTEF